MPSALCMQQQQHRVATTLAGNNGKLLLMSITCVKCYKHLRICCMYVCVCVCCVWRRLNLMSEMKYFSQQQTLICKHVANMCSSHAHQYSCRHTHLYSGGFWYAERGFDTLTLSLSLSKEMAYFSEIIF